MSAQSIRWLEARWRAGADAELTLVGWSMAPALRDGDRLRVASLLGVTPAPGEIVVARRGERLVTHRLVSLAGGLAVTRGDGCHADDPALDAALLLGRVVEVRRGRRRLAPPSHQRTWRQRLQALGMGRSR
jgi:hypothetical protein